MIKSVNGVNLTSKICIYFKENLFNVILGRIQTSSLIKRKKRENFIIKLIIICLF